MLQICSRESGLSELTAVMRTHLLEATVRDRVRGILAETAGALEELAAPDRLVAGIDNGAGDAHGRMDDVAQQVTLLRSRPPGPRLERLLTSARASVEREFEAGLVDLQETMLRRVDNAWDRDLGASLGDEMKTAVDALWGEATNSLRNQIAVAAGEIFGDYALGEVDDSPAPVQALAVVVGEEAVGVLTRRSDGSACIGSRRSWGLEPESR